MAIFLFQNSRNPVEYCATDTRSGHRLPASSGWLYRAELQNALHAAVFGVTNFEAARRTILRHGYLCYTAPGVLRNCS